MIEAARWSDLFSRSAFGISYCLLTPFCTASGCLAVPVLFGPAALPAPEVLASPPIRRKTNCGAPVTAQERDVSEANQYEIHTATRNVLPSVLARQGFRKKN